MGAVEKTKYSSGQTDLDVSDLGRPDTMRYNLLSFVINEEYDRAIKTLKDFIHGETKYANFRSKIERYGLHGIDLIHAIRTKRNFSGVNALTRTKQQELREKFKEHFSELKATLKKIENCMEELRLDDVKSTRILVKSVWLSLVTLFIAGFAVEIYNGLWKSVLVVIEENIVIFLNWIFTFIL